MAELSFSEKVLSFFGCDPMAMREQARNYRKNAAAEIREMRKASMVRQAAWNKAIIDHMSGSKQGLPVEEEPLIEQELPVQEEASATEEPSTEHNVAIEEEPAPQQELITEDTDVADTTSVGTDNDLPKEVEDTEVNEPSTSNTEGNKTKAVRSKEVRFKKSRSTRKAKKHAKSSTRKLSSIKKTPYVCDERMRVPLSFDIFCRWIVLFEASFAAIFFFSLVTPHLGNDCIPCMLHWYWDWLLANRNWIRQLFKPKDTRKQTRKKKSISKIIELNARTFNRFIARLKSDDLHHATAGTLITSKKHAALYSSEAKFKTSTEGILKTSKDEPTFGIAQVMELVSMEPITSEIKTQQTLEITHVMDIADILPVAPAAQALGMTTVMDITEIKPITPVIQALEFTRITDIANIQPITPATQTLQITSVVDLTEVKPITPTMQALEITPLMGIAETKPITPAVQALSVTLIMNVDVIKPITPAIQALEITPIMGMTETEPMTPAVQALKITPVMGIVDTKQVTPAIQALGITPVMGIIETKPVTPTIEALSLSTLEIIEFEPITNEAEPDLQLMHILEVSSIQPIEPETPVEEEEAQLAISSVSEIISLISVIEKENTAIEGTVSDSCSDSGIGSSLDSADGSEESSSEDEDDDIIHIIPRHTRSAFTILPLALDTLSPTITPAEQDDLDKNILTAIERTKSIISTSSMVQHIPEITILESKDFPIEQAVTESPIKGTNFWGFSKTDTDNIDQALASQTQKINDIMAVNTRSKAYAPTDAETRFPAATLWGILPRNAAVKKQSKSACFWNVAKRDVDFVEQEREAELRRIGDVVEVNRRTRAYVPSEAEIKFTPATLFGILSSAAENKPSRKICGSNFWGFNKQVVEELATSPTSSVTAEQNAIIAVELAKQVKNYSRSYSEIKFNAACLFGILKSETKTKKASVQAAVVESAPAAVAVPEYNPDVMAAQLMARLNALKKKKRDDEENKNKKKRDADNCKHSNFWGYHKHDDDSDDDTDDDDMDDHRPNNSAAKASKEGKPPTSPETQSTPTIHDIIEVNTLTRAYQPTEAETTYTPATLWGIVPSDPCVRQICWSASWWSLAKQLSTSKTRTKYAVWQKAIRRGSAAKKEKEEEVVVDDDDFSMLAEEQQPEMPTSPAQRVTFNLVTINDDEEYAGSSAPSTPSKIEKSIEEACEHNATPPSPLPETPERQIVSKFSNAAAWWDVDRDEAANETFSPVALCELDFNSTITSTPGRSWSSSVGYETEDTSVSVVPLTKDNLQRFEQREMKEGGALIVEENKVEYENEPQQRVSAPADKQPAEKKIEEQISDISDLDAAAIAADVHSWCSQAEFILSSTAYHSSLNKYTPSLSPLHKPLHPSTTKPAILNEADAPIAAEVSRVAFERPCFSSTLGTIVESTLEDPEAVLETLVTLETDDPAAREAAKAYWRARLEEAIGTHTPNNNDEEDEAMSEASLEVAKDFPEQTEAEWAATPKGKRYYATLAKAEEAWAEFEAMKMEPLSAVVPEMEEEVEWPTVEELRACKRRVMGEDAASLTSEEVFGPMPVWWSRE